MSAHARTAHSAAFNGLNVLPARSGLYLVVNIATGRRYVGATMNVLRRCRSHMNQLAWGEHPNYKMQFDANTHGVKSFVFVFLEGDSETQAIAEWGASRLDIGYNLQDRDGYTTETNYRLIESRLVTKGRFFRSPGVSIGTPLSAQYLASWAKAHPR